MNIQRKTPKAGGAAKGVNSASLSTIGMEADYTQFLRRRKRLLAEGPSGEFSVAGKRAMTLCALVSNGDNGVIALELSNTWALRLGAYVHDLRKQGLEIETIREPHDDIGGWHARYVLHSPVTILGEIA
ncbi:helix-turn-helix domain-containing protein [uncultured Parasphingorhabdus sp.]|uniref:winged helix domain-containing protein n=1 Tax=uncultured Parasphingorhabdus sp. TaxID=2709694 RepID=UPI0030D9617B|tara:strand:+ start:29935 stop:30321 length:387 start_codon:yes stop_codon:yes gene_type:complete